MIDFDRPGHFHRDVVRGLGAIATGKRTPAQFATWLRSVTVAGEKPDSADRLVMVQLANAAAEMAPNPEPKGYPQNG